MKIIGVFLISILLGFAISFTLNKVIRAKSNNNVLSHKVHSINLEKDRAVPDAISIKLEDYIQFNAKDGKYHNIALGKGNDFNKNHDHDISLIESGIFGPDEAYKLIIKEPGTYNFHDHKNPNIFVAIVVYK